MKLALIFTLVLAVALLQAVSAQSHNNQWGTQGIGDVLLHREIATKEFKYLKIVTQNVEFKTHGTISYIKATDQYTNDNGGFATLQTGGPGMHEVTVHLKSKRNHGFNFIIEIYGK